MPSSFVWNTTIASFAGLLYPFAFCCWMQSTFCQSKLSHWTNMVLTLCPTNPCECQFWDASGAWQERFSMASFTCKQNCLCKEKSHLSKEATLLLFTSFGYAALPLSLFALKKYACLGHIETNIEFWMETLRWWNSQQWRRSIPWIQDIHKNEVEWPKLIFCSRCGQICLT